MKIIYYRKFYYELDLMKKLGLSKTVKIVIAVAVALFIIYIILKVLFIQVCDPVHEPPIMDPVHTP